MLNKAGQSKVSQKYLKTKKIKKQKSPLVEQTTKSPVPDNRDLKIKSKSRPRPAAEKTEPGTSYIQ